MRLLGSSLLAVPFLVAAMLMGPVSTPVSAMASPGPYPMPFRNADYDARLLPSPRALHSHSRRWARAVSQNKTARAVHHHEDHPSSSVGTLSSHKAHKTAAVAPPEPPTSRFHRRQSTNLDGLLSSLQVYSSNSQSDSQDLREWSHLSSAGTAF